MNYYKSYYMNISSYFMKGGVVLKKRKEKHFLKKSQKEIRCSNTRNNNIKIGGFEYGKYKKAYAC